MCGTHECDVKKLIIEIHKPSSLSSIADRINRLQSKNDTLKSKNQALLEQFVIWQYNDHKHGLKEQQLNAPLPRIDRERHNTFVISKLKIREVVKPI